MIDTVILELPNTDYHILDHEQFNPPTYNASQGRYLMKYINNPTADDKRKGKYKPRLTIMKRKTRNGATIVPLRIEFSVPKLLFRNNIDELRGLTDIPRVSLKLQKVLNEMGVSAGNDALMKAKVCTFHVGKNIELQHGFSASFVIRELAKINLTKQLDLSKTEFRNEGHGLQYYSQRHSLVFYDKKKDLQQPLKRRIDSDPIPNQQSLFDLLETQHSGLELLRMEVRLCNRTKIKQLMKKLGLKEEPYFADLFDPKIPQTILKDYWYNVVMEGNRFMFVSSHDPRRVLQNLLENQPDIKTKEALYLVGLYLTCKDKGVRDLRSILGKHFTDRTWARVRNDLKRLDEALSSKNVYGFIPQIESELEEFKPYKLTRNKEAELMQSPSLLLNQVL